MREIKSHHVPGNPETVRVFPEDEPGKELASPVYRIALGMPGQETGASLLLKFQRGPIPEVGVNGITNEALLAIVADRLEQFQKSPLSCRENSIALIYIQNALMWLQRRTRDRIERGVEGSVSV